MGLSALELVYNYYFLLLQRIGLSALELSV